MRIAINTRFLLPGKLEGIGWYTYEICRRLVENHPEHIFYFIFDRPFSKAFVFGSNVIPIVVPPPARHPLLWHLWFEWSLPFVLKKIQPDVFFSPDGYLSVRSHTPTLLTIHDLAFLHFSEQVPNGVLRYYTRNIPRFLNRADRVLTISNFVKQDILTHYAIDAARIHVIHNGLRQGFYPLTEADKEAVRQRYTKGSPYFFYVGALHPRKNLPRLIRAFSAFKAQTGAPLHLLIGGRMAWQTGEIFQAWEASAYQTDIQFLGYLPQTELNQVLGAAFALTYLSLFEGFGLPILEAYSCEVPVITSNTASMPEVAGDAALLIDPHQETEITGAMRTLWEHPEQAAFLIHQGQIQREKFSWENAAEQIHQLLLELVGQKKCQTGTPL